MSPRWTTQAQEQYLRSQVPYFIHAQKEVPKGEALDTFRKKVFSNFLDKWPVDEAEDGPRTKLLRERIYRWFYQHGGKDPTRQASSLGKDLVDRMITKKRKHPVQPILYYHRVNKDKLQPLIQQSLEDAGAVTRRDKMILQRRVLRTSWENEDESVIQDIEDACRNHNRDYLRSFDNSTSGSDSDGDGNSHSRTPQSVNSALADLPQFITSVFEAITKKTGWVFLVSAGGPLPADQGKIYIQNYHFGPKNSLGQDFGSAYPKFSKAFKTPFSNHVSDCFSSEERLVPSFVHSSPRDVDVADSPTSSPPRPAVAQPPKLKRKRNWARIISDDEGSDGETPVETPRTDLELNKRSGHGHGIRVNEDQEAEGLLSYWGPGSPNGIGKLDWLAQPGAHQTDMDLETNSTLPPPIRSTQVHDRPNSRADASHTTPSRPRSIATPGSQHASSARQWISGGVEVDRVTSHRRTTTPSLLRDNLTHMTPITKQQPALEIVTATPPRANTNSHKQLVHSVGGHIPMVNHRFQREQTIASSVNTMRTSTPRSGQVDPLYHDASNKRPAELEQADLPLATKAPTVAPHSQYIDLFTQDAGTNDPRETETEGPPNSGQPRTTGGQRIGTAHRHTPPNKQRPAHINGTPSRATNTSALVDSLDSADYTLPNALVTSPLASVHRVPNKTTRPPKAKQPTRNKRLQRALNTPSRRHRAESAKSAQQAPAGALGPRRSGRDRTWTKDMNGAYVYPFKSPDSSPNSKRRRTG